MTHGRTLVMLPADTPIDQREQVLQDVVTLFTDWFPGTSYDAPCSWCQEAAIAAANEQVGTFPEIGISFLRIAPDQRPAWRDYGPLTVWQDAARDALVPADPTCEYCEGQRITETKGNASRIFLEYWDIGEEHTFFPEGEMPEVKTFEVLITLDGKWHHRWSMQDATVEVWAQRVTDLIREHPGHILALTHMAY